MFCPKCRTEYRKDFTTCADCEISLVEELPPAGEHKLSDKGFHPIRDQIDKTLEFIRKNQKVSWIFALLVGVIFILYMVMLKIYGH